MIQQTAIPGTEPEPEEAEGSDLRQDLGVSPSPIGETAIQHGVPAAAVTPPLPQALALKTPEWGVGEGYLAEYERTALRVATSVALPKALRCDGDQRASARAVLAIALAGRELGLGFLEATRMIDLIDGQTALRAELKMALARRQGLVVDEVIETPTSCTIKAHRTDTGEAGEGTFTMEDKKRAGLGQKERSAWTTYPADMLWARAATRLTRRLCPDFRGASFRTVEELTEAPGGDGYGD